MLLRVVSCGEYCRRTDWELILLGNSSAKEVPIRAADYSRPSCERIDGDADGCPAEVIYDFITDVTFIIIHSSSLGLSS